MTPVTVRPLQDKLTVCSPIVSAVRHFGHRLTIDMTRRAGRVRTLGSTMTVTANVDAIRTSRKSERAVRIASRRLRKGKLAYANFVIDLSTPARKFNPPGPRAMLFEGSLLRDSPLRYILPVDARYLDRVTSILAHCKHCKHWTILSHGPLSLTNSENLVPKLSILCPPLCVSLVLAAS